MKIKQLSIFLENRIGVLNEIVAVISESGINMKAFSVVDSIEFGILRLIVSDTELAQTKLQEAGFKVNSTDVIRIYLPNKPGGLSSILECLASEGVFIKYMYAFSEGEVASTIIQPTDIDRCCEILDRCGVALKGSVEALD